MNLFQERDYELIAEAKKAIRLNYDQEHYNHTVGAAIRCKNGKVYVGVNEQQSQMEKGTLML